MFAKRDWASLGIGWSCGFLVYFLVPEFPWKILLVFLAGFVAAFIVRELIR